MQVPIKRKLVIERPALTLPRVTTWRVEVLLQPSMMWDTRSIHDDSTGAEVSATRDAVKLAAFAETVRIVEYRQLAR